MGSAHILEIVGEFNSGQTIGDVGSAYIEEVEMVDKSAAFCVMEIMKVEVAKGKQVRFETGAGTNMVKGAKGGPPGYCVPPIERITKPGNNVGPQPTAPKLQKPPYDGAPPGKHEPAIQISNPHRSRDA